MKKAVPLTEEDKERIKNDIKRFFTSKDIKAINFYNKNLYGKEENK